MSIEITWHGHSNFQISDGQASVILDPFFEGNPSCKTKWHEIKKPDLVLVTHGGSCHGDHTGQALVIAEKFQAPIGCIVELANYFMGEGLDEKFILNGMGFNMGGTIKHQAIEITMTPAFHSSGATLPAGFVVKMPSGFTFYHAGDTSVFGDMAIIGQLYPLDLALLPIGGIFTMDAKQAGLATKLLNAKNVIGMHYGTFGVLAQDDKEFAAEMQKHQVKSNLITMQPNTTVKLG